MTLALRGEARGSHTRLGPEKSTVSTNVLFPLGPGAAGAATRRQGTPGGALCSPGNLPSPALPGSIEPCRQDHLQARCDCISGAVASTPHTHLSPPANLCHPGNLIEPAWLTDRTTHHGPHSASATARPSCAGPEEIDAPSSGGPGPASEGTGADCRAALGRPARLPAGRLTARAAMNGRR